MNKCCIPIVASLVLIVCGCSSSQVVSESPVKMTSGWIDEISSVHEDSCIHKLPFNFMYDGKAFGESIKKWDARRSVEQIDDVRTKHVTAWKELQSGLEVTWETIHYADYPAVEWMIYFENTGAKDTAIIEQIQVLDLQLDTPVGKDSAYRLHKTRGAPSGKADFEVNVVDLNKGQSEHMGGSKGRSSNSDFPFFKVETGMGSIIVAVGWSGRWQADLDCIDDNTLQMTAGLQKAHFRLHPGEKVRMPRILVLHWQGDTLESNAQFRQLIYKHYAARRDNKRPLPTIFCNTCFCGAGGWFGDANTAKNQTALVRAYGPLGIEAVVTDAGWMEGSKGKWYMGCGNWTPRKDNYPDGMAPIGAAALEAGLIYGIWYEVESVIKGTTLHKEHPEWIIDIGAKECHGVPAALFNFGIPEAREHMINVVKRSMDLPGINAYRQDFGLVDPAPHWDASDTPDRVGMTEINYITGLYAFWDGIAEAYPDSLREECAAGGRRIDLETVMRMHIHQKTDHWFDNETDQLSIWGLSQYLPNNCIVAQLNRRDNYSFHSTIASSLCVGWRASQKHFPAEEYKVLVDRYKEIRHLLVGAWYPLTPYSREDSEWLASQYHRPDLDEGIILAFKRSNCEESTIDVALHGLNPDKRYQVTSDSTGRTQSIKGSKLMKKFKITLPADKRGSDLIHYQLKK